MILISLIIQSLLLIIVLFLFRRRVLAYTGTLFFLMMFIYHGLPEILNILFPEYNFFRNLVTNEETVGETVLLLTAAMFLYMITYVFCLGKRIKFNFKPELLTKARYVFDNNRKPLIIIALIFYFIGAYYRIKGEFSEIPVSAEYWIIGAEMYFGNILFLLAFVSLILARNRFFPLAIVIGIQIIIGITTTARSAALLTMLITLIFVQHFGFSLRKRTVLGLLLVALASVSLISITRGIESRQYIMEQSKTKRLALFLRTPSTSSIQDAWVSLLNDFVYRFDGNSSNALILDRLKQGFEPVWFKPLLIDFSLQIPRALYESKLEGDITARDAKAYMFSNFGYRQEVDYLQGWLGYLLASFGIYGLLFSMIILGFMMAVLDKWFIRTSSFFGITMYFIVVYNTIFYELTPSGLLSFLRTFVVLFVIFSIKEYLYPKLRLHQRYIQKA